MTSSANLTFRARINGATAHDLSPNAAAAEFREEIQHHGAVIDATAEYLRRCGRDVAECSHLSPALKEDARDFHLTYRAFMAEWLDILAAAEAAADEHAAEVRTPVTVQSYGSSGFIPRVSYGEAAE